MKKRIIKALIAIALILFCIASSMRNINAEEATVKEVNAVMYSGQSANVYVATDTNSGIVTSLSANLPVQVTGITSNGWYRVNINGVFYMQANSLKEPTIINGEIFTYSDQEIKKLLKGTYSFFKTSELSKKTLTNVMDMDENTYIKYLDSYISGYGVLNDCIIRESGLKLSEHVALLISKDASKSAKSNKEILIDYRNKVLEESFTGPHRTSKTLLFTLTRAIRYGRSSFVAQFKNASIADDEVRLKNLVDEVTETIKKEQGVIFDYTCEYKDEYWNITFTKK